MKELDIKTIFAETSDGIKFTKTHRPHELNIYKEDIYGGSATINQHTGEITLWLEEDSLLHKEVSWENAIKKVRKYFEDRDSLIAHQAATLARQMDNLKKMCDNQTSS